MFFFFFKNSTNSARMPIFSTRHVDEIIVTEWCAIFHANLKTRIKITKKSGHMNTQKLIINIEVNTQFVGTTQRR